MYARALDGMIAHVYKIKLQNVKRFYLSEGGGGIFKYKAQK